MINKIVNPLDLPVGTDYKDEDTTIIVDSVTGELKQVLNKTIKDEGGASNLNDVLKGGNVATDTQATNGIELQYNGENVKINNTIFLIEKPSKGFETSINNSSLNIKDQTSNINLSPTGLSVTYNGVEELNVERSTIRINNGAEIASILPTGFDFSGTGNGSILFPVVKNGDVKTFALEDSSFYDEGDFSPVIEDQGGGAVYNQDIQWAKYTRIGNSVNFTLRININSTTGSRSGNFVLNNMPFNCKDSLNYLNAVCPNSEIINCGVLAQLSDTSIDFRYYPESGSSNTPPLFKPNTPPSSVYISGSYITDIYNK